MLEDVDHFLYESNYTESTQAGYAYHLFRFANWIGECGLQVTDISASLLNTYLKSQGWGNNTQRQAGNAVKSFMRWRYGQHSVLSLKLPKDNAGPGRHLNEKQLEDLMASFDTTKPAGWRDLSMIALMAETGIREREICRLNLKYLDLRSRRFTVMAKREKWREGVFSSITARYLDVWLDARRRYVKPGVTEVFVGVNGKTQGCKMTPGGLRKNFRKYGARVDSILRLSPHDLRRTMAMLLTQNGAPSRVVQELGGWEDIRMVERYTRSLKPGQIDRYSPLVRSMGIPL